MMIYPGFQGLAGDFSWMYWDRGILNTFLKIWEFWLVLFHHKIFWLHWVCQHSTNKKESLWCVTSVRVSRAWRACPRCTSGPPWPRSGSGQAPLAAARSHNRQIPHSLKIIVRMNNERGKKYKSIKSNFSLMFYCVVIITVELIIQFFMVLSVILTFKNFEKGNDFYLLFHAQRLKYKDTKSLNL